MASKKKKFSKGLDWLGNDLKVNKTIVAFVLIMFASLIGIGLYKDIGFQEDDEICNNPIEGWDKHYSSDGELNKLYTIGETYESRAWKDGYPIEGWQKYVVIDIIEDSYCNVKPEFPLCKYEEFRNREKLYTTVSCKWNDWRDKTKFEEKLEWCKQLSPLDTPSKSECYTECKDLEGNTWTTYTLKNDFIGSKLRRASFDFFKECKQACNQQ